MTRNDSGLRWRGCRLSEGRLAPRAHGRSRGFHQIELLFVLATLAALFTWGLPRFFHWSSGLRVRLAAEECVVALRKARHLAISESSKVGLKFRVEGERYSYTLYRDGDGDGLLTVDIDSGVDPELVPLRMLAHMGADVRFGFPEGVIPADPGSPGSPLDRLDDPIRFGNSDIASFSALGESTPGSLYLTGSGHLFAVRVFGRTGKVKVIRYERASDSWY